MIGLKMSWFYFIFFFSFIIGNLGASHHRKKNPSAVVVGTVYCDTCFQDDFSKSSHFISGASVAVECKDETSKPSFQQEVKTDEHGEFKVNLPFSVREHVKKIKRCSVKLISSSEPYCAVASTATSTSLHLKERKQGIHIFSAGFFTFKPLKQPSLCNKKPRLENSKELNSKKTSVPPLSNPAIFPPPIQDPPTPDLPSISLLPRLPQLPTLTPLPGLPNLPPMPGNVPGEKPEEPSRVTKLSEQKAAHPDCFFPPSPPHPFLPTPFPPSPPIPPPCFPPNPMPPVPELTPPSKPSFPGKKPEEPVTKLSEQKAAHPDCFFPPFPPNPFLPAPPLCPSPLQPPPFCPPSPLTPPPCFSPNPLQPPSLPPYQYQPPPQFPPNPRMPPPSPRNRKPPPSPRNRMPPPSPRNRKPPPSPRNRMPPPSPRSPMPPVPGLTPSSKPSFPFLFPFPPIPPTFPGIPPASSSPKKLSP